MGGRPILHIMDNAARNIRLAQIAIRRAELNTQRSQIDLQAVRLDEERLGLMQSGMGEVCGFGAGDKVTHFPDRRKSVVVGFVDSRPAGLIDGTIPSASYITVRCRRMRTSKMAPGLVVEAPASAVRPA